jgi:hypothetical protein
MASSTAIPMGSVVVLVHKVWQIHFREFPTFLNPGIGTLISKTKREPFTVETTHQTEHELSANQTTNGCSTAVCQVRGRLHLQARINTEFCPSHRSQWFPADQAWYVSLFFSPFSARSLLTNPWAQSSSLLAG